MRANIYLWLIFLSASGLLVATEEPVPLVAEWQLVPACVIDAAGQAHQTTFLDFASQADPQAAGIREILVQSVKELPSAEVPNFVRAFSTRGFNRSERYLRDGKVVKESTPLDFELHPSDEELFAAEVAYLQDCIASNAYVFLKFPPLDDQEREIVQSQLEVVFTKLSEIVEQKGFSEEVRKDVAVTRRKLEALTHPGCYGRKLQKLDADKLKTLPEEADVRLPGTDELKQMSAKEQQDVLRAELRLVFDKFICKKRNSDAKLLVLQQRMQESGMALTKLNRKRMLATQPACSMPASQPGL